LRNVKIQAQQNYLPKRLPRAKALRPKSFTSSESKEAKEVVRVTYHVTQQQKGT